MNEAKGDNGLFIQSKPTSLYPSKHYCDGHCPYYGTDMCHPCNDGVHTVHCLGQPIPDYVPEEVDQ